MKFARELHSSLSLTITLFFIAIVPPSTTYFGSFTNSQAVHRCTPDAILLVGEYAPIPLIADFHRQATPAKQAFNPIPKSQDICQNTSPPSLKLFPSPK